MAFKMNWDTLLNSNRQGNTPAKCEKGRSPFMADYDKIMFSESFRRLAKKTQVHPMAKNDHIHNRLTHSLEVSCVGRSLGLLSAQKLFERGSITDEVHISHIGDIVQSACLVHDIGNPPFGHTGEEAIRTWFKTEGSHFLKNVLESEAHDLQSFEGNAQGLRVITTLENHLNEGGLRLTYATIASFIKYPWTAEILKANKAPHAKFGIYRSELTQFHEIAEAVGLKQIDNEHFSRHPLAHLMEAADDICYGIIDLEDGLEMNILQWEEVYAVLEPVIPPDQRAQILNRLSKAGNGQKATILRGSVIDAYVHAAAEAFVAHEDEYLAGDTTPLIELCDSVITESIANAKKVAKDKIFLHPRKVELEIGAYTSLATLLSELCQTAIECIEQPKQLSFNSRRIVELIGEKSFLIDSDDDMHSNHSLHYRALIRVIDFISGMTDNYAAFLAKQFTA